LPKPFPALLRPFCGHPDQADPGGSLSWAQHGGRGIPTICEWAGGRAAFAHWLDRFYDLVEAEAPDIAALFGGHVSREHREHVTDWWTEVMGGPPVYSEQRGGYEHMLGRHHGLAITSEQRLAFVTLLSRAAR
jgi:hemoglobin